MNTNTLPAHRVAKMKLIQQGLLVVNTPAIITPAQKQGAQELAAAVADVVFPAPTALAVVLKGQDLKADALYKFNDEVYKVIWNKAKTHKYAMRLVFNSWMKKGKFMYAAAIINLLDSTMQLDLEGAKGYAAWAFQKHGVGVCCQCGKLLTNPESVENGIGPVCGGKIKKSWF